MLILYRKSDLACVGTVSEGMTGEQEIELNVIPNFGGITDNYGFIETEEKLFHLELVNGIVSVIKEIPQPIINVPTEVERLSILEGTVNFLLGL